MDLDHGHSPDEIRARLQQGPSISYLRDWVYGGIDGAVTTFAVVSGVVGARLPAEVILVLGAANLVADGFSMAAANFSGTQAEREQHAKARAVEERHVETDPEGELEELRQIFAGKGFEGEDLQRAVEVVSSDKEQWVRTMLTEEYGLPLEVRSPASAAASTMVSFVLCGALPLLPYVADVGRPFLVSSALTGLVFFSIGSGKSRWTLRRWWIAGGETLLVGGAAASLAWLVGWLLRDLVG